MVEVTVTNDGSVAASNVLVRLYAGDPSAGGQVLAEVDIPLERPRSWDRLVEDDAFKALSNQVLQLVRSA